jgi:PAS domain S-box-containing protein
MRVDSIHTETTDPFDASPAASLVGELEASPRPGTTFEDVCNRLCQLATRLLGVPAAVISLREKDSILPVGVFGLDEHYSWGRTPLSISLSGHPGGPGDGLAIADVRAHALLSADPLHTQGGFLSFLAVSLDPDGQVSGTLCALARAPRAWSREDEDSLGFIAASVLSEIRLVGATRRNRALERVVRTSEPEASEARARVGEEEGRARRALESAQQAFVSLDEHGFIREWNRAAEKTFGWTRSEALGRELADLLLPERFREAHRDGLREFQESGGGALVGRRVELEAQRKNGAEVPVELSITAVDENGSWAFNAFLSDISERRRAERERLSRERLLSYAQRVARMGSWEWDIEHNEFTWSEEMHKIFGTDPAEFDPTFEAYMSRLPASDRDLAQALVHHALETGEEFTFEHQVIRPDGSLRAVLGQGRVERGSEGRPIRMLGTAQDVTERKELEARSRELAVERDARVEAQAAEAKLRASEARYRFLSDAIPQQVWTALPDGRLEYVNQVVIDYLGVPREAAVDQTWDSWIFYQDVPEMKRRWEASRRSGDDFEMELRLLDGEGVFRWHLVRAKAQKLADGSISRWYGTNTNVHDLKELERDRDEALQDLERVTHLLSSERTTLEEQARELRRFALALQRSNRELDQFAYVASHDLKAPLRGIANLAVWLSEDLQGRLDEKTAGYLRLLDGRVHRMESLIDGILQYARAGRPRDEPESVDVARLVQDAVDMLAPPERFNIRVEGYMPVLVTERSPLEQVFLNLLSNAVKHADNEAPEVIVSVTDEGGGWFEFSVSDNGPGIAPEYHERIFTIFQTLKARDDVESTGIGLSVVKRIVEWQGGQVWVESETGQGATFRFLWPDAPREAKEAGAWRAAR